MPDYRCTCGKTVTLSGKVKSLKHSVHMPASKCSGTLSLVPKVTTTAAAVEESKTKPKAKPKKDRFAPVYVPKKITATPAAAPRVTPSKADASEKLNATAWVLTESRWADRTGKKEGESGLHAERTAYLLVQAFDGWIAFVQNAPPCRGGVIPAAVESKRPTFITKYCDGYFGSESMRRPNNGFIFVITAPHAGYDADWKALNDNKDFTYPFYLYCVNGNWTLGKPNAECPDPPAT